MSNADDFFSGGNKSVSFKQLGQGTYVVGRIIGISEPRQAIDMDTNKPKVWPNSGDAIMQIGIDLQTDLRDPANPADTGVRTLYVEKGTEKFRTLMAAVRAAGVIGGPKVGGWVKMAWTGNTPNKRGSGLEKKLYTAEYTAPSETFFTQQDQGQNGAQQSTSTQVTAQPQTHAGQIAERVQVQQQVPAQTQPAQSNSGGVDLSQVDPTVLAALVKQLQGQQSAEQNDQPTGQTRTDFAPPAGATAGTAANGGGLFS